jgi:exopolysaccharide biosynthesis polyprenyl glycosylphosphotransferase
MYSGAGHNYQRIYTNQVVYLAITDITLTLLALHLASWARYLIPWGPRITWRFVALPWPVYLMASAIWPVVLTLASAYDVRPHAHRRTSAEIRSLLLGMGIALLVLAGALYFSYRQVPRRLVFYFGVIDFSLLALARVVAYSVRRIARHNGHAPQLLIAGAGRVGEEIARKVQRHDGDWHLIGFLDDDPAKVGSLVAGVPVLGTLDALEETVLSRGVDEVVFALPLRAHERLMQLVVDLERLPVEASVVPDYFDLAFHRTRVDELLGFPLIRLRASAIEGRTRVIKRLFDLGIAFPLLVLCAPLFPLIALAIRIDSPGRALFKQARVGENCQPFGMWKLRTMVQNADQLLSQVVKETPEGQIIYKQADDQRVTRVGRFLRRYSLDELPQLINVIKGEMSLVGPRPELPWLVDRYAGWQRKRFAVPPGLTGWWQISGRSDRPMHLHVEDDLYYIQNYSIWLDLRILWRTVGVVLSGKGAF